MEGIFFLLAALAVIILSIVTLVATVRRKPVKRKLIVISTVISCYAVAWFFFLSKAKLVIVPLGTDICFDDWCATITKIEKLQDSTTIILYVTMSNHARGIAQTPDEPRIILIDTVGKHYTVIKMGKIPLNARLQLHESLQTTLIFTVPKNAKGLKALIEEGPFIANFIFPDDEQVFFVR